MQSALKGVLTGNLRAGLWFATTTRYQRLCLTRNMPQRAFPILGLRTKTPINAYCIGQTTAQGVPLTVSLRGIEPPIR